MTPDIPTIEQITTPVREINERIHELVFKPCPLTAEEWDELREYERMAG